MQIIPYLTFAGDCAEAFRFYEEALEGEIQALLPFEGNPGCEEMPAEWRDKVLHACLKVGDFLLMGSDPPPQMRRQPAGISVNLNVETPAEAERVFQALSEGATVHMPLGETFWAQRFGMLTDRYGTPWMVNCSKPG